MVGNSTSFFGRNRALGTVQVWILKVIEADAGRAYGTAITETLSEFTGRAMADAQVYMALRRLEQRGFISAKADDLPSGPSVRSRGRPRKVYELTASGKRALESVDALSNLDFADWRINQEVGHGRQKPSEAIAPVVG